MRRVLTILAVVAALLIPGTPALAHNRLVSATPAGDSIVAAAPAEISLVFAERLNPEFTTVAVSDAARRRIPTGAPVIDGATGIVPLSSALGNGLYTVAYRVVSVDGHTVQGSYTFTVADPAQPAAAAPEGSVAAADEAAAPASSSGGIPLPLLIGLVAAGVLLVAAAGFFLLRGRRRGAASV